jgi:hypothetical protein
VKDMSKKELKNNNKPPKKKKTAYEKRKFGMKIAGYLMALIMLFGAVMTVVGMFIGA